MLTPGYCLSVSVKLGQCHGTDAMQRRATWDGSPGKPPSSPQATPTSFSTHQGAASPRPFAQGQGGFSGRAGLFSDEAPAVHSPSGVFSSGLVHDPVHQQVCRNQDIPRQILSMHVN